MCAARHFFVWYAGSMWTSHVIIGFFCKRALRNTCVKAHYRALLQKSPMKHTCRITANMLAPCRVAKSFHTQKKWGAHIWLLHTGWQRGISYEVAIWSQLFSFLFYCVWLLADTSLWKRKGRNSVFLSSRRISKRSWLNWRCSLQHTATRCVTMQHTALQCNIL